MYHVRFCVLIATYRGPSRSGFFHYDDFFLLRLSVHCISWRIDLAGILVNGIDFGPFYMQGILSASVYWGAQSTYQVIARVR